MSDSTYLALFRKIEDSFVYQDSGLLHLWIHCLIRASFKDRTIMFDGTEIELKRGQFITGRKSLAKALRTTEQKIRSRIALLEKHNQICMKSTNKYSIITVVKYEHYQDDPKKITNRQPTDNQQITTNNKVNKVNNKGDKSPLDLFDKEKDMWNNKSDDYEEGVVDYDSGELTKPEEKAKGKNREQNARKKELVDWLIFYQKRDPVRTNRPKQLKALNRLIEMRVTGAEAQQIIMEEMQLDFWREKKEKPDFCTVVAIIEKRGE